MKASCCEGLTTIPFSYTPRACHTPPMPHPSPGAPRARSHHRPAPRSRAASAALLHLGPQTFVEFARAIRVKIVNLAKFAEFGRLVFRPPPRRGPGCGSGGVWPRVPRCWEEQLPRPGFICNQPPPCFYCRDFAEIVSRRPPCASVPSRKSRTTNTASG